MEAKILRFREKSLNTLPSSSERIGPYMLIQSGGIGIVRIAEGLSPEEIEGALGKLTEVFAFLCYLPPSYRVEMSDGLSRYIKGLEPRRRSLLGLGLIFSKIKD